MKKVKKGWKIAQPVAVPCLEPKFRGVDRALMLHEDYRVRVEFEDGGWFEVGVPGAYEFDASIPEVPFIKLLIGGRFEPEFWAAAAVHDWLYQRHLCTREEADDIFEILLSCSGVPAWRRILMHRTLRLCGGRAWQISTEDKEYVEVITEELWKRDSGLWEYGLTRYEGVKV